MIGVLVAMIAIVVWSVVATVETVARDGYRAVPTLER
jgi:hypothetical protein